MTEEKCTFVQNLSSTLSSSQIIMNRDLTQSNIERQNILNNRFAVENIAKSLDVVGMLFEGEYRFTKQMVADFYQVDERTIERCVEQNIDELKHNGYILSKGKQLKDLKLQFAHVINVGSKTTQLALFNFRSFLNIGMLLTESDKAKQVRSIILDPTFTPKKFFHRNSGLFTRVRFCKSLIFNICFVSRRNICVL